MNFIEIFNNKEVSYAMKRDACIKGCSSLILEVMKTLQIPFEEAILYVKDSVTAQAGYHSQLTDYWVDLAAKQAKEEQDLS